MIAPKPLHVNPVHVVSERVVDGDAVGQGPSLDRNVEPRPHSRPKATDGQDKPVHRARWLFKKPNEFRAPSGQFGQFELDEARIVFKSAVPPADEALERLFRVKGAADGTDLQAP